MKKICLFIICFVFGLLVVSAEGQETTTATTTTKENVVESNIDESGKVNEEEESGGLLTDGKSAIIIEASTGKVIYEKNAHERYAPASMTKIMSMILIMEEIEKGNLKWDDVLTTSEYASSMGGSQIFLQPNEKMSVKDLFKAVAIGSANDVAVTKKQSLVISEEIII